MECDLKLDIIIVGEMGVGKTSIMTRFAKNTFKEVYTATVAVDYLTKDIEFGGKNIKLNLWDSAGQEVYKCIVPQYFRKTDGCMLVYDVTKLPTFSKLSGWLDEFRLYNETAPVIIVGNKCEDPNQKAVNRSIVKSYAEQEEMAFIECSAKTGHNVDEAFQLLFHKIWENLYPPVSSSRYNPVPSAESNESSKHLDTISAKHEKTVPPPPRPKNIVLTKEYSIPTPAKKKSGCC